MSVVEYVLSAESTRLPVGSDRVVDCKGKKRAIGTY
jgi:hypothetical protein